MTIPPTPLSHTLSSCQYFQNGKAPFQNEKNAIEHALIVCDDVITPGDLPIDKLTAELIVSEDER